jgi:hypothetical protein
MASTNIPGFYYDRVKKKYFKIQPNHIAPTGSAYSRDSVKKDAEDILEAKERAAFEWLERKQIMQRSKVLTHPLGGRLTLEQETGLQYDSIRRMNEAWVYGIQDRTTLTHHGGHDIGQFVYDEATGSFIFASVVNPIDIGRPIMFVFHPSFPELEPTLWSSSSHKAYNTWLIDMQLRFSCRSYHGSGRLPSDFGLRDGF